MSKFLRGLAVVWPETFLFCPLYVFIHLSASFCTGSSCPRSCQGSCAIEMSIIIIIVVGERGGGE